MGNVFYLGECRFTLRWKLIFPHSFLIPTYCLHFVFESGPWIKFSVIVFDLGN